MISWHSNWAIYARGWGLLFRFFDPGVGILTEKISGPVVSPGGGW